MALKNIWTHFCLKSKFMPNTTFIKMTVLGYVIAKTFQKFSKEKSNAILSEM